MTLLTISVLDHAEGRLGSKFLMHEEIIHSRKRLAILLQQFILTFSEYYEDDRKSYPRTTERSVWFVLGFGIRLIYALQGLCRKSRYYGLSSVLVLSTSRCQWFGFEKMQKCRHSSNIHRCHWLKLFSLSCGHE